MRIIAALVLALWAGVAAADDAGLVSLETGNDGRGWEGVGRLDVDGGGFCTASLISDRLVLTAAHCLFDQAARDIDAARLTFRAGLRSGRAEAERGIRRYAVHPDYVASPGQDASLSEVARDIAVLELDLPIRLTRVQPFAVEGEARPGGEVGIVSYAQGREEVPSLQEVCAVLGRQEGIVVMTCDVDFGASGSPVFALGGGVPRIVSVISGMAEMNGERVALGTSLGEPLRALMAHFEGVGPARPGGSQGFITAGQRGETGARFIRP